MNIDPDMKITRVNLDKLAEALFSLCAPGVLVWVQSGFWMYGMATIVLQLYILMVVQIYTGKD